MIGSTKIKHKSKNSKLIVTLILFGYIFLFTPIIILILNSFGDSDIPGVWTHFTLKWYEQALTDKELLSAVFVSLKIATISATISCILGTMAAIGTTQPKTQKFLGRKFLNNIIIMPIVMPEIITGFSLLMLLLGIERIIGITFSKGIITVCLGHIIATMAYVHMNVSSKIKTLDKSIEEAALNFGARPLSVFWKIKLPMLSSAITTSWILVFTMSLDDLVIASFLAGPGSTTLPILLFSNIRVGITPMINAFATMFILTIVLFIIINYFHKKREQ